MKKYLIPWKNKEIAQYLDDLKHGDWKTKFNDVIEKVIATDEEVFKPENNLHPPPIPKLQNMDTFEDASSELKNWRKIVNQKSIDYRQMISKKDTSNKRQKSPQMPFSNKSPKLQPKKEEYFLINTKIGIDFEKIATMDPNTDMMDYIENQAALYKQAIESAAPNGLKLVNKFTENRTGFIPCGKFNQDNSCESQFEHSNTGVYIFPIISISSHIYSGN